MFRFFVKEKKGNAFNLSQETLNHIKVSRVEKKEFICVHESKFYLCILEEKKAKIIKNFDINNEFEGDVIIAASLINIKRFEWLIQKATELGATKLIPIISDNISIKIPKDIDKKISRWQNIAINASEQSFRNNTMKIEKIMHFKDAINLEIKNKYIAHEKSDENPQALFETNSLFFVGPEGGFSKEEIELAKKAKAKVISLGKRILRAETASIFILSRVN